MRYVYLVVLLLSFLQIHAQDISGKWVGNYGFNLMSSIPDKLVIEIFIHNDSVVSGTSHLYHGNDKYEHYAISGVYHKADSTIYFKEDSTIGVQLAFGASNVLGNYTMKLKVSDTMMYFNGKWKENNSSLGLMNCKVWLVKPLPRMPLNNKDTIAAKDEKLNRALNVQKLIEIEEAEKDSIKIMLVDNGQVDGDVITLYLNDSVLLSNQRITGKSLIQYVSIGKDMPLCKLLMVAENEGEIPPCTAHLTVITRKKTYQLNLFSNAGANGAIQFFLKE